VSLIRPNTSAEFSHPISTYVATLSGFVDTRAFVGGTAVIIAPGFAITASHVIEEIWAQFGYDRSAKNIELDIYVNQLTTGACWYVCHASSWIGTDITVLSLKARNEQARSASIGRLPIAVDPPPPEANVTALGYPNTELTIPRNDHNVLEMNFSITPTVSEGTVIEIHRSFRDTANLRFPCFAVNAEFTAGMSGGAVFDQSRQLCGLVCSGGKGELKEYSPAVSAWPMAIIPVTVPEGIPPFAGIIPGETYKLLDLARLGYIQLNGHERIEFFRHENDSDGVRRHHPQ
jgi:hypothetical protein